MPRVQRRTRLHLTALLSATLVAAGLAGVGTAVRAPAASAHGNVDDPIARGYRCSKLYGGIHLSTSYKDSDPMCWSAFQTSASAMWNWNGMLRDGLAGNYSSVKDLCSADVATYKVLSVPGNWIPTPKSAQFKLNLVDGASHGADWLRIYISKDGFDPTTKALGWDDVVQIGESGRIPISGNGGIKDPLVGGSAYTMDVDASGYPGRRVLFTLWKASHADQTYYLCSDVTIAGGSPTTTTTTVPTTTTTTVPPTTTTTTTPPTTTTTSGTTTSGKPVKVVKKCKTGKNGKKTCRTVTRTPKVAQAAACAVRVPAAWPGGYVATVSPDAAGRTVRVLTPRAAGATSITPDGSGYVVTGTGDPSALRASCAG